MRTHRLKIFNAIWLCGILFFANLSTANAQQRNTRASNSASANRERAALASNVRSLPRIASQDDFDKLSRINTDAPYPLPNVMFVIDRSSKNKIYYVNSKTYRFHKDFVNGTYLSLERGREFFENNYLKPNRRFILGNIAYQTPVKRWTFEFWEGDLIPAEQIKLAYDIINQTFFAPVAFKPNSTKQDEDSAKLSGLERVLQTEISQNQEYLPLNLAKGLGRIHIIEKLDDHVEIGFNEILVLNEVPVSLPPVAGIITTKPSTPLSHINLLAKGWNVPNAYIKNANELFKQYDGWWVDFETKRDTYTIKRASLDELKEYQARLAARLDVMTPRVDLETRKLATLTEQRAAMVAAYGAKSANLGEMMHAHLQGITIPNGFTIPVFYYDQFLRENKLDEAIYAMLNDQKFVHDPAYRRQKLTAMRASFQAGKVNDELRRAALAKYHEMFEGRGVFVRSTSNVEDLPNFNGAGLYTTVPNAKTDEQIIEAIKTVWGSIWNFEAYEARERAGVDHSKALMAVLIQEGINADSAGVIITTDPFNKDNSDAIYISAKKGLGIKVVEGQKVAEQIIYRPRTQAVKVLTRSAEDSLLTFDAAGGVKEVPIAGERYVLTDQLARRLARAAMQIQRVFHGKPQDIEWVVKDGQIYIVQSRPFIAGG
jgi:hypothetical protein